MDDDGARVQCHLCGRFFPKLGTHISRGHRITPDEYREWFGLNRETPLASPQLLQRLSDLNRAHLARVRPAVNAVTSAAPEQQARWRAFSRRQQVREALAEKRRGYLAEHPRTKQERSSTLGPGEAGRRRIAELLPDEAWRRARNAAIAAGSRTLTENQVREIAALRGTMTQVALARRYHVTERTIRRIWRGEAVARP